MCSAEVDAGWASEVSLTGVWVVTFESASEESASEESASEEPVQPANARAQNAAIKTRRFRAWHAVLVNTPHAVWFMRRLVLVAVVRGQHGDIFIA